MERNRITTNRKTTPGRRIYYQDVMGKLKDVYDNRLVQVKNTRFWKFILWLGLIKKSFLIVRKDIKVGEIIGRLKTIKHLQVSEIPKSFTKAMETKNSHISSRNPNTIAKRIQKNRGFLIWDSSKKGTYMRKLHGELK
jgi:hypothetical protein